MSKGFIQIHLANFFSIQHPISQYLLLPKFIREVVKIIGIIAGFFGFIAVALGAFGSHGLKAQLAPEQLQVWETAVKYHFIHTLAILACILLFARFENKLFLYAAMAFLVGILFFSGSLYLLSTKTLLSLDAQWLGPLTPLGGLIFIVGWILIIAGFIFSK